MSRVAVTVVTTSFVVGCVMLACGGESTTPPAVDPDGSASSTSSSSSSSSGSTSSGGTDGSTDGSSSGDAGSDAAPADKTEKYARAFCDAFNACAPVLVKIGFGDAAACVTRVKSKAALDLKAAGVSVTEAQIDACLAKIASIDCSSPTGIPECQFKGTLADGAACDLDAQCLSGSCFKPFVADGGAPQRADCGTCKARAAAGADCSAAACADGHQCLPAGGNTFACVKQGAVNEACSAAAPCGGNLACVGGTCKKPLALNAACRNAAGEIPCATARGEYCKALPNQNGTCSAVSYATPPNLCGIDVAALNITQCTNSTCSSQIPAGTCTAYLASGADCSGGGTCAPPLECRAGKCAEVDPARCK